MSLDLFPDEPHGPEGAPPAGPLADRMRPDSLSEVVGQDEILGEGRFLRRILTRGELPSVLLWGPPGTGKTTIARLLAGAVGADLVSLSAVTSGIKELRDVVARAETGARAGRKTVLFIDEIHRFNKAQQDALLPHVEKGTVTFIGATTENPSFEVNAALLSRLRTLVLKPLSDEALSLLLTRALEDGTRGLGSRRQSLPGESRALLLQAADGDGRRLLNLIESASGLTAEGEPIPVANVREALQGRTLRHDKSGEEHFNLVSALHKSIRDSDPDGSLYWLARLMAAGEDRLYLVRRLVRIALEDVGLADPGALSLAVAARDAFHFLGEPEGDLALAEVTIYLALAPKSASVLEAFGSASEDAVSRGSLPVPLHLRNAPTRFMARMGYGRGYRYAHDAPEGTVAQDHLPKELGAKTYYVPGTVGHEVQLAGRLEELKRTWAAQRSAEPAGSGDRESAPD